MSENPTAFPCKWLDPEDFETVTERGMSLRDWFAGQAFPGVFGALVDDPKTPTNQIAPLAAKAAYHIADAMLAERLTEHTHKDTGR